MHTSDVALFLLSTAMVAHDPNALKPGELGRWTWEYSFYQNRTLATSATWAADFEHVYFVWGKGAAEEAFLDTHADECGRDEYRWPGSEFVVLKCPGAKPILYVPSCTAQYYGADGPCCRAQAAMAFVLGPPRGHPHTSGAGGGGHPPHHLESVRWWGFMDDDVYVRRGPVTALLRSLDNAKPVFVGAPTMHSFGPHSYPRGFHDSHTRGPMARANVSCNVECIHAFPWAMAGFLSLTALRTLEPAVRRGDLQSFCKALGLSHDGGVGGFVAWRGGIPYHAIDHAFVSLKHSSQFTAFAAGGDTYSFPAASAECGAALVHGISRRYNPYMVRDSLGRCAGGAAGLAAGAPCLAGGPLKLQGAAAIRKRQGSDEFRLEWCDDFELPPGVSVDAAKAGPLFRCRCPDGRPTLDGSCAAERAVSWVARCGR